jgi:mRNA interferase RelE/StbE
MQVIFLTAFYKDLNKLENRRVAKRLQSIIMLIENSDSFDKVPQLKKLKGHSSAYRIRIQNYRVGIFVEGNTVEFARILPRKDVYKFFPK